MSTSVLGVESRSIWDCPVPEPMPVPVSEPMPVPVSEPVSVPAPVSEPVLEPVSVPKEVSSRESPWPSYPDVVVLNVTLIWEPSKASKVENVRSTKFTGSVVFGQAPAKSTYWKVISRSVSESPSSKDSTPSAMDPNRLFANKIEEVSNCNSVLS